MPQLLLKFSGSPISGNRYYAGFTQLGMKLVGLHGYNSMLYVMEYRDLHKAKILNYYDPAYIITHSVPIGSASLFVKEAVIQYIAYNEVGISRSIPVVLEPLGSKEAYGETKIERVTKSRTDRTGKKGDFMRAKVLKITIHPYSINIGRSQYYDIYLNLVHEKEHAETPHDAGDEIASEYTAYQEVMYHPYYIYASDNYRRHVEREFRKYERLYLSRL